jgi:hypothetical protein
MIVFSEDQRMIGMGAKRLRRFTHGNFYKKDKDSDKTYIYDRIDHATMERFFVAERLGQGPIVLNIEHSDDELALSHLADATKWLRQNWPGFKVGWYRHLPKRDYWNPVKYAGLSKEHKTAYEAWQRENERRFRKYSHLIDIVLPSIYTFYEGERNLDEWKIYAEENIKEARWANKLIYPYLMPNYHGNNKPIPDDHWREQLRFVARQPDVDGICVFSSLANHDWQTAVAEELLWHSK